MRYMAPIAAASLLAGCSILENDVERGYERSTLGPYSTVYTTADIRIVTLRPHPMNQNLQIECAEPSPDVAKALAAAVQLSANVADKGSGSFAGSSAEALSELAGRSTALLGLRDGLFRACEAYANGAIGDTAYALVLARYGQLMTTLFLGQDVAAKTGAPATLGGQGYPSGYNVNITASGNGGAAPNATANQPKQPAAAPKKDAGAPAAAAPSADPGEAEHVAAEKIADGKLSRASVNQLIQLASLNAIDATPAQHNGGHQGGVGVAAEAPALASPAPPLGGPVSSPAPAPGCTPPARCSPTTPQTKGKTVKNKTATTAKTAAQPAPLPSSEAAALYKMNDDFIHLDASHLFLVACLNEYDVTRIAKSQLANRWLQEKCNQFVNDKLLAR